MNVHHVALRTDDVPRLLAFYRDVLDLPVVERPTGESGAGVWLAAGSTLLMLEPRNVGEPGIPPGSMELVAFAIRPEERASVAGRLDRAGVAIEGQTAFTLYCRDPDGRRVGVSHFPERGE